MRCYTGHHLRYEPFRAACSVNCAHLLVRRTTARIVKASPGSHRVLRMPLHDQLYYNGNQLNEEKNCLTSERHVPSPKS